MYSENNLKRYMQELIYLREFCQKQSEKLDLYCNELNLLKDDLNSINQINLKTKEFLQLEFESNLDKQKQIQIKYENKLNSFQYFIDSLQKEKQNNELKITNLNETVGRLKQSIDEKNQLLSNFEKENADLNNTILNCNDKINSL